MLNQVIHKIMKSNLTTLDMIFIALFFMLVLVNIGTIEDKLDKQTELIKQNQTITIKTDTIYIQRLSIEDSIRIKRADDIINSIKQIK